MSRYAVKSRADSPVLRKAAMAVEASAWNALGYLNFTRAHFEFYEQILEEHADCQLCLVDEETGYPVAVATCAPVACKDLDQLPAEGWDWIVQSAGEKKTAPNLIGGLGISVSRAHRSKGLARLMIKAMGVLAQKRGFDGVVIPVRPTAKTKHQSVPIHDYIGWTDENGRAYDPWLRSHLAAGGKIVGAATKSMVVNEPVAFWETWSGRTFPESGAYEIDGALTPVMIDVEKDRGAYEEPNVWFAYAA